MNYTKLGERLNRFEYSINTDNDIDIGLRLNQISILLKMESVGT